MKVEELRVGNWVNEWWSCDEMFMPTQVTGEDIIRLEEDWRTYEPIELTKEWYLNFGFKEFKGEKSSFFLDDFTIYNNLGLFFWKGTQVKSIKHVHQLQNLYFALTNKDLVFQEDI